MPATSTASAVIASPVKLRSGAWGVTAPATVQVGDAVTIRTSGGKEWPAEITKIVWTGNGKAICETRSLDDGPRPASPAPARSSSCGYGVRRGNGCSECRRLGRMCKSCEFDEYDM